MVIVDDATNNCDAFKLRTVSIEYNRIPYRIHFNILKSTQTRMIIG
jgi:vacuolar-type H+-ATPase subunit B/Vma2